jgi:hypothetical protein
MLENCSNDLLFAHAGRSGSEGECPGSSQRLAESYRALII